MSEMNWNDEVSTTQCGEKVDRPILSPAQKGRQPRGSCLASTLRGTRPQVRKVSALTSNEYDYSGEIVAVVGHSK
jgi:hypothetical protein